VADADGTPADAALRLGAEAAACQGSQGCTRMQIGGLARHSFCKHTHSRAGRRWPCSLTRLCPSLSTLFARLERPAAAAQTRPACSPLEGPAPRALVRLLLRSLCFLWCADGVAERARLLPRTTRASIMPSRCRCAAWLMCRARRPLVPFRPFGWTELHCFTTHIDA